MAGKKLSRRILMVAMLAALGTPVYAQSADKADKPEKSDKSGKKEPTTLDAVTVVAQKREEKLQDVPIVVTSLPAQLLQQNGVHDIKDMQFLVPGFTVTSSQNEASTTVRIRGIGTVGDNVGLESSVGVVIDGVYRPRNGVGFGDLGEIDHIEVLKGPQGTLFGKNTSAGVVNVITKRPEFKQSGDAEMTFGNYGAWGVAGSYNDAINDKAAFRVYAAARGRDGFQDVYTGNGPREQNDDMDQNFHTFRGQLLLLPSDTVDVNISTDYTKRNENCCAAVPIVVGTTAPLINAIAGGKGIAAPTDDPFNRVAYSNRGTQQYMKDKGISAEVNWTTPWFNQATVTSITALRDWNSINGTDLDFTAADIFYRNPDRDESFTAFHTFSQELRMAGSTDRADWLVGLFYSDENLGRNNSYRMAPGYETFLSSLVFNGLAPSIRAMGLPINNPNPAAFLSQVAGVSNGFAGLSALDRYKQNDQSIALFTNDTWHATDAFDITLGLRYTHEKKELDSYLSDPNGNLACSAVLANPAARVAAGLAAQGVPINALSPAQRAALLGALAPQIVGRMCLPWSDPLFAATPHTYQERSESEWSGTLKGAYRWNEHWMTYVSAARGYKAGGFNLDRAASSDGTPSGGAGVKPVYDTSFPGEFVNSYELGAKSTWMGGNLLLNGTLFYQDYTDFQLNSFLGTGFVVRSIPQVVSKGVDADLLWKPAQGWMVQAGLTYADTRYGDHIPGVDFVAPAGAMYKLPGSRLSYAPEWSGTASATYDMNIGSRWMARFNLGAKYQSSYNTGSDLDVEKIQHPYTLVNARVGFGPRDNHWMIELWGENVTNAHYYQLGFDMPLQTASSTPYDPRNSYGAILGAPATYGLTLRIKM